MQGQPSGLPAKPLEFNDFSGGITENILQGDPRRYQYCDNFFITVDHKLRMRPGFVIDGDDSYQIAGFEGQRINNYHLVHTDSVRMPQVSRSLFYLNPTFSWSQILGVGGKQALSGGDAISQTTSSEFQRVIYFATDDNAQGVLPSKVYLDDTNIWVARTAGLPRSWVPGNFNDATLLAKCIVNANAIRAAMVLHFLDSKRQSFLIPAQNEISPGQLHINVDKFALSYFQTVTFNVLEPKPSPVPTPLGPCVDQATMFALVNAINTAFTEHVADGMKNSWGTQVGLGTVTPAPKPNYHQDNATYTYAFSAADFPFQRTKGPGPTLQANSTPSTLAEAAAMLDDILQKWNWHRLSVNIHDWQNDPSVFDRYAPVCTAIGDIHESDQSFATITPDWSDIIGFANNLKFLYNSHVTNNPTGTGVGGHKMRDNFIYNAGYECRLPDATDLNSAFLLIYWCRSLYQMHIYDAQLLQTQFINATYTSTAGSATITAVNAIGTGVAVGPFLAGFFFEGNGTTLQAVSNKYNGNGIWSTARVITNSVAGTFILDSNFLSSLTGVTCQISNQMYHRNTATFGTQTFTQASIDQTIDSLNDDVTTVGIDKQTWLLLGQDLFFTLSNHMQNDAVHQFGGAASWGTKILSVPYSPFFLPAVETSTYAMFYQHKYTVEPNGIEYLVRGNPVFSDPTEIAISYPVGATPINLFPTVFTARPIVATHGNLLTNLPSLKNDAVTNYATDEVTLEIYRTTDGGQTFFFLASLPNGTSSYLDIVNDSLEGVDGSPSLDEGEALYTSGGVVGDDQPPQCKYTHILNGVTYWGAVVDTGQYFPNRIRQSKPNAPDSSPASFFDDFDSPLVGISSTRNNLIVVCETSIYRESGQFNTQGQGSLTHENISDTLGGLNAKSIVPTEIGVFLAGTDGFYYTDGYQIINITYELKDTYAKYTRTDAQRRGIQGYYDKIQRRILWTMREGDFDSDSSVVWVYYLAYGVKPSGVFTTISNGLNFRPSSLIIQRGTIYYAHEKGFLLKSDPWNKWDALIDPTQPGFSWAHTAIPWHYKSVAVDLGTTFQRKYITKVHLVGKNTGNVSMTMYADRDLNEYNQGSKPMAGINYLANMTWGDPRAIWGDTECIWKTDGKLDLYRRMPAGQLRSDFMQIEFKPADQIVYSYSQDYPDFAFAQIVDGDATSKIVKILTPSGFTSIVWPTDVVGMRLSFDFDEYEAEYLITARAGGANQNEIIISDPTNFLPITANTFEWQISGIKIEQAPFITSYVMHYAYLGDENQSYPGSTTGSGPGNGGANP